MAEQSVPVEIEVWKEVSGWSGYQVSQFGRVRSLDRLIPSNRKPHMRLKKGCHIVQRLAENGYMRVTLQKPGTIKSYQVGRLVVAAFIGNLPDNMQVNHKDGNKTNNHVSNLEIVSCRGNIHHAILNNLFRPKSGETHSSAKITRNQAAAIIDDLVSMRNCDVARKHSVSLGIIESIKSGKSWKDIERPAGLPGVRLSPVQQMYELLTLSAKQEPPVAPPDPFAGKPGELQ